MAEPKQIQVKLIAERNDKGEVRQPYAIMRRLIGAHHPHLADARIALAWQFNWKEDADGRLKLGQCRKASDLDFCLHQFDFVILLNSDAWNAADFTEAQMAALLDHELTHAQVSKDENGEDRRDTSGRPVWRIRKHDIEEFTEIVARHGLYKGDLEKFAKVAMDKVADKNTLFGGFGDLEGGEKGEPEYFNPGTSDVAKMEDGNLILQTVEKQPEGEPTAPSSPPPSSSPKPDDPLIFRDDNKQVVRVDPAAAALVRRRESLIDQAAQLAIERGEITAEAAHRKLQIPLKQAIGLLETLKEGHILKENNGRLVSAVNQQEWEELKKHATAA